MGLVALGPHGVEVGAQSGDFLVEGLRPGGALIGEGLQFGDPALGLLEIPVEALGPLGALVHKRAQLLPLGLASIRARAGKRHEE